MRPDLLDAKFLSVLDDLVTSQSRRDEWDRYLGFLEMEILPEVEPTEEERQAFVAGLEAVLAEEEHLRAYLRRLDERQVRPSRAGPLEPAEEQAVSAGGLAALPWPRVAEIALAVPSLLALRALLHEELPAYWAEKINDTVLRVLRSRGIEPPRPPDRPRPRAAEPEGPAMLSAHGIRNPGTVHAGLAPAAWVELALARGEGVLADNGALVAYTGAHTGRSPKDRYLVAEPSSRADVSWGPINRPMEEAVFERLLGRVLAYLQGRDLFVCDASACAEAAHALPVRVVADRAWHALFAHLLLRAAPAPGAAGSAAQALTILCASGMHADPEVDGTRSEVFIVLHLGRGLVLIGGTGYAGEIKKSVFSVLNYLLPRRGVFPMHCSANVGPGGDTALFFGLSGTGKTTLSADPGRRLIGDDEHGWSDAGVFNIEGGCYAKTIRLSRQGEPQIWDAIRFGSVLENVPLDPATRRPLYDDDRITENTRAAYPLEFIDHVEPTSRGGHPRTILFLTCDAFGVLPPLSRLTAEQALYHFLLGYTAKVAGTEAGVREPEATFSACFAAPFLPLHPARYADLLAERLARHGSEVWLVNTGWAGGPYGRSRRIPLEQTRAIVRAILGGALAGVPLAAEPYFGLMTPERCPGVPSELLRPHESSKDPADYSSRARHLAGLFRGNFDTYYAPQVSAAVREAGPRA
jgi:phosphoenolpyruvate carboxykinase (ATP)